LREALIGFSKAHSDCDSNNDGPPRLDTKLLRQAVGYRSHVQHNTTVS
jgi:hypothetical protein